MNIATPPAPVGSLDTLGSGSGFDVNFFMMGREFEEDVNMDMFSISTSNGNSPFWDVGGEDSLGDLGVLMHEETGTGNRNESWDGLLFDLNLDVVG